MPEQTRTFRDLQEVTEDDMMGLQTDRQDALDHVVVDTVWRGNGFTGFPVSAPTTTDVLVGNGRAYFGGQVYFNDTNAGAVPPGATIPLATYRPSLQSKIVTIVAVPKTQPVDEEPRDFEIDATTNPPTYQPQTVTTITQRWADLQAVDGPELVSPVKPGLPSNVVAVAYVTMTTAGITAIEAATANQIRNLQDVAATTDELEADYADVAAKTATVTDDVAKLQAALAGLAGLSTITSLAADVARIKAQLNLPASYVNYRENDFTDASGSNPAYSGYVAKVDQGLRFADDAADATQLGLFNPYDPAAKVSGGGVLLPAYTTQIYRIVKGNAGTLALAQYSYQTYGLVQATMSRQRIRYGAEFEEALGTSYFAGGTFLNPGPLGIASTFEKNGETFQVYDTGQVNPDGQEIVRLANYWQDTVSTPYWQRVVTTGSATGFAWFQSWLQDQSGWCLGICPKIAIKDPSAPITFAICGTVDGQPDLTNIIAKVTVQAADVVVGAPLGNWTVPIEPTFLQAGTRYSLALITAGSYSVYVADISSNGGGTCFYALDGGVLYPSPSQNIMFDLAFASFTQNRVSINLGQLSLSGGIAAIDILASTVVPSNTGLVYEIQVNGVWTALAETQASALLGLPAGLPPLVPFRATFTGTANLMPGLMLSGSVCTVSRPKTVLKEGSIVETLASASSKITIKSTLVDFDPAHHAFHAKVLAAGTLRSADTETPVAQDSRTTVVTSVFNLPAAVTSYVSELDGTSDNAANLFHVASTFELAA